MRTKPGFRSIATGDVHPDPGMDMEHHMGNDHRSSLPLVSGPEIECAVNIVKRETVYYW